MAGTRSNNTMDEGLRGFLQQLALLKVAPDADLDFLSQVEMGIIERLKAPQVQAMQQFAAAGGVLPPGAMGPQAGGMPGMGGPPPAPAGVSPPPGPGVPGLMNPGGPPPVDELRRLLAGKA
jgi:hypothetical protein